MNPKITIILPTYNRKILLRRALNSMPLSKDYQVIIIDDGSTDGSWHLIEEWFKTNKDDIHHSSRGIKKFLLYEARWQASSPILALCMWLMGDWNIVIATIIANLIGGCIFYFVDKRIFKDKDEN